MDLPDFKLRLLMLVDALCALAVPMKHVVTRNNRYFRLIYEDIARRRMPLKISI